MVLLFGELFIENTVLFIYQSRATKTIFAALTILSMLDIATIRTGFTKISLKAVFAIHTTITILYIKNKTRIYNSS